MHFCARLLAARVEAVAVRHACVEEITKGAGLFEQTSPLGALLLLLASVVYIYSNVPTAIGKLFADGRSLQGLHSATVAAAASCLVCLLMDICLCLLKGPFLLHGGQMTAPRLIVTFEYVL